MAESFLKITQKFDFKRFRKRNKVMFEKALAKGAIELLNWSANGSSKVPEKPPIRQGILKGSGSAFVGNKLIDTTAAKFPPSKGIADPNTSYNGKPDIITIGYNTAYAASMHEKRLNPGVFSQQAGNSDPGNKWLQRHLAGDGEILMNTIGKMMKSELNK